MKKKEIRKKEMLELNEWFRIIFLNKNFRNEKDYDNVLIKNLLLWVE